MAGTGLGFRRVEGIGERSVSGTLAGLLSLTSDAVLAFDGFGRILMSNEAAERLFGRQDLVGSDVRALFPPAAGVVPEARRRSWWWAPRARRRAYPCAATA